MKRNLSIKPRIKKASDIYKKQNTLIHRAMHAAGFPYAGNKDLWLPVMNEIASGPSFRVPGGKNKKQQTTDNERRVSGLSDMTLGERHQLIVHFQKKGMKLFSPSVPEKIRDWKKGDKDIEYEFREDGDPQVRMIFAMWAEMGYRRKTLYGLCFKLFGKDHPRWLNDRQLTHLVNAVKAKAKKKGCGVYWRKRA